MIVGHGTPAPVCTSEAVWNPEKLDFVRQPKAVEAPKLVKRLAVIARDDLQNEAVVIGTCKMVFLGVEFDGVLLQKGGTFVAVPDETFQEEWLVVGATMDAAI